MLRKMSEGRELPRAEPATIPISKEPELLALSKG